MEQIVISKYGVTLRQLTHDKIEMVRLWRNDPKIQQYMEYREEITPEMQERWFQKMSCSGNDLYFIIEFENEEIGLINVKDMDPEKTEGESGVFIYEDKFLNRDISYRAHIAFFDFLFNEMSLKGLRAHVLEDNIRAIRFVQFLGYELLEGSQTEYYLYKDNYINNKNRIRFIKKEEYFSNKNK